MFHKPDIIVGTWGMSAFDTAPTDFKQLIASLQCAGARVFDSALVYGQGSIDEHLGKDPDIKVITKIPAIDRDALRNPSADFNHHYPRQHVRSCVERLLAYHQGTIDTLLLHNWHPDWRFDQVRDALTQYTSE
ncbi:MAG: aldo/keto reductase [bacterium]